MAHLTALARRFVPERLKPPLRAVRRRARRIRASVATPFRAHAYGSPGSLWLRSFPSVLRQRWRLTPPPPGHRRIEVGSGLNPRPGYVHVDVNPDSVCLDFIVSGHSLPIRDEWTDEVLSVHMVEHVPPPALKATLREWCRVLREGGTLRIHTPNGEAIGRALVESASGAPNPFWAVQSAIFGYFRHPKECIGPEGLRDRGDHTLVFTFPVLRTLLEEVGFSQVENISGQDPCYHFLEWEPYVSGLCLEVRAVKSNTPGLDGA
jgi:SAM-dependent methyltransferase